jgi:hypothetical protein
LPLADQHPLLIETVYIAPDFMSPPLALPSVDQKLGLISDSRRTLGNVFAAPSLKQDDKNRKNNSVAFLRKADA